MVDIEAGRYGLPQLIVSCRVNRPRKSRNAFAQDVSKNPQERYDFNATWRPGVRCQDEFMMDKMRIQPMTDSRLGRHHHKQAIVDMCPGTKDKSSNVPRVIAITFIANATRVDDVHPVYWAGLPEDVRETFNRIFLEEEPFRITIWLKVFPNPKAAIHDWGRFLQTQVNMHVTPRAQYQHANGAPFWDSSTIGDNKYYASSIDAVYPSFVAQMRQWDWQAEPTWGPIWIAEQDASWAKNYEIARKAQIIEEEPPEIPLYRTRNGLTGRPIDMEAAPEAARRTYAHERTLQEILDDPTHIIRLKKFNTPRVH